MIHWLGFFGVAALILVCHNAARTRTPMFNDLYDAVSKLWSWRWPIAEGEVTEAIIERIADRRDENRVRLAVAYKFSIGDDGPYTGECFWEPLFHFSPRKKVMAARRKIRIGNRVRVRYRPDDPSVNTLDHGVPALVRANSR